MAGFVEKVLIEVEARTAKAVQGFKDTGAAVKEAEGFANKAKTAFTGSVDAIVSNMSAAQIATAAVTASVAAGSKLIGQFQDLVLEVGKFSDATGLSAQQSSRWVEVLNDMGIGTDQAQVAFGKLEKAIGTSGAKLEGMGLQIARAKDGTVDMNATILNAIDLLNNTKDAGERAAIGSALFGKGWQSMAELVAQGSDKVAASLKGVQDSKVFDAKAVEDARAYRDEMNNLRDSIEGVELTLGHLLSGFEGPAVQGLANVATLLDNITKKASEANTATGGWLGNAFKGSLQLIPGIGFAVDAYDALTLSTKKNTDAVKEATPAVQDYSVAFAAGLPAVDNMATAEQDAADAAKELADETAASNKVLEDSVQAAKDAEDALNSMDDAILASADAGIAARKAHTDYNKALKDGKASADDRTEAALKAADADVKVAENAAEAAGKTFTASDKNRVLIASLSDLAAQASGPTKLALQAVVDQLKAAEAHSDITFNLDLNNQQFMSALNDAIAAAKRAGGTFAGVGSWILGASPASTSQSFVTVNVPPTLSPDRVLAAMGAGERRSGGLRRG